MKSFPKSLFLTSSIISFLVCTQSYFELHSCQLPAIKPAQTAHKDANALHDHDLALKIAALRAKTLEDFEIAIKNVLAMQSQSSWFLILSAVIIALNPDDAVQKAKIDRIVAQLQTKMSLFSTDALKSFIRFFDNKANYLAVGSVRTLYEQLCRAFVICNKTAHLVPFSQKKVPARLESLYPFYPRRPMYTEFEEYNSHLLHDLKKAGDSVMLLQRLRLANVNHRFYKTQELVWMKQAIEAERGYEQDIFVSPRIPDHAFIFNPEDLKQHQMRRISMPEEYRLTRINDQQHIVISHAFATMGAKAESALREKLSRQGLLSITEIEKMRLCIAKQPLEEAYTELKAAKKKLNELNKEEKQYLKHVKMQPAELQQDLEAQYGERREKAIRKVFEPFIDALLKTLNYCMAVQCQEDARVDFDERPEIDRQLFEALEAKDLEKLQLLLDRGGNPNAGSACGVTLLHAAAGMPYNSEFAKLLIARGAHVFARDQQGRTARESNYWQHAGEVCQVLLESEARVEKFFNAAKGGLCRDVELLLPNIPNINCINKYECTPLHEAAEHGHDSVVRLLLEKGAQVNAHDQSKQTPLYYAAKKGHLGVIKLLLERGASVEPTGKQINEGSALDNAATHNQEDVVRWLLAAGAPVYSLDGERNSMLEDAGCNYYDGAIGLLLDAGANPNAINSGRATALQHAVVQGCRRIVLLLLKAGISMQGDEIYHALHMSMGVSSNSAVALLADLLMYGASEQELTEQDKSRMNSMLREILHPLEYAALKDSLTEEQCNGQSPEVLTRVLLWSVAHSRRSVDFLLTRGARVEEAIRLVASILLQTNKLNAEYYALFEKLLSQTSSYQKQQLLGDFLVQAVRRRNSNLINFLCANNAPVSKALEALDWLNPSGQEDQKLLNSFFKKFFLMLPLEEKVVRMEMTAHWLYRTVKSKYGVCKKNLNGRAS